MTDRKPYEVPEKSLKNIDNPEWSEEAESRRGIALPKVTIEKLFTCLAEGMSMHKAAKAAGTTFKSAQKYYERGDPRRHIKPLKMSLMVFQEKVQNELDGTLLKRRKHLLGLTMKLMKKIETQIDIGALTEKATITQFEKLVKLEMHLRGLDGPITKRTVTGGLVTAEDIRLIAENQSRGVGQESESIESPGMDEVL